MLKRLRWLAALIAAPGSGQPEPAADPPIDCFSVYPTISRDAGMNSDLEAGGEERAVATIQFARFAHLCRPFAPVYRQATLASLPAAFAGGKCAASPPVPMATCWPPGASIWRFATPDARSS